MKAYDSHVTYPRHSIDHVGAVRGSQVHSVNARDKLSKENGVEQQVVFHKMAPVDTNSGHINESHFTSTITAAENN